LSGISPRAMGPRGMRECVGVQTVSAFYAQSLLGGTIPAMPARKASWANMNFAELNEWISNLGAGETLPSPVRKRASRGLPAFIHALDPRTAPRSLELPTGEYWPMLPE
jgi:hypothetical protein